jgi:hypothetical protein
MLTYQQYVLARRLTWYQDCQRIQRVAQFPLLNEGQSRGRGSREAVHEVTQ